MVKVVKDGFEIVVTEGAYKNQFAPLGFTIVEDEKVKEEKKLIVEEKPVVEEKHEEEKPVSRKK